MLRTVSKRSSLIVIGSMSVICLFPLLVAAVAFIKEGFPETLMDGDLALIELAVRAAANGKQYVGVYSRFGFNHPGPLYFYLLLPLYWLTNFHVVSCAFTVVLMNMLVVAGILFLLWRQTPPGVFLWCTVLLTQYLVFLGTQLHSFWNPTVPILPLILLVLCLAIASVGEIHVLVPAACLASFAVQTHIGYSPAVAAMVAVSLGLILVPGVRKMIGIPLPIQRKVLRTFLACALVSLVLWSLPLYEEFTTHPGNFSKILSFFRQDYGEQTWREVLKVFCGVSTAYVWSFFGKTVSFALEGKMLWFSGGLLLLQNGLLLCSYVWTRRHKQYFGAVVAVLCVVFQVMILFSLKQVVGEFYDYIVVWMTSWGLLAWMVIGYGVYCVTGGTKKPHWGFFVSIAVLLFLCLFHGYGEVQEIYDTAISMPQRFPFTPQLNPFISQMREFLHERNIRSCHLKTVDGHFVPAIAGIVLKLSEEPGMTVTVDPGWAVSYPEEYLLSSAPEGMFLFSRPDTGKYLQERFPELLLAAQIPNCSVFWHPFSAQSSKLTFSFEALPLVTLQDTGFYQSEPIHGTSNAYRWSAGGESMLRLPLDSGSEYRMTFVAFPLVIPGKSQAMTLLMNNHFLESVQFAETWEWQTFHVHIPGAYVQELNHLVFQYKYCDSPQNLGLSPDSRLLAVGFKEISFEKVPKQRVISQP